MKLKVLLMFLTGGFKRVPKVEKKLLKTKRPKLGLIEGLVCCLATLNEKQAQCIHTHQRLFQCVPLSFTALTRRDCCM